MKFADVKLPSNKTFGLFFAAVFALVSIYFFIMDGYTAAGIFAGVAAIFAIVALTKPQILLPLNKLWMRFGLLLGMIMNPIILGVLFFGFFTPIALLMRLFGRDELQLKPKKAASYWKVREPNTLSADTFKQQF